MFYLQYTIKNGYPYRNLLVKTCIPTHIRGLIIPISSQINIEHESNIYIVI